MSVHSEITQLAQKALSQIRQVCTLSELDGLRVAYLGKKGHISDYFQQLGLLPPEERKSFGATINAVKVQVTEALDAQKTHLEAAALESVLKNETVDITLPIRPYPTGHIHPLSFAMEECISILSTMGFDIQHGPDIEDDFHNFTALNIPADHPARQMQDTFYLNDHDLDGKPKLLRTHTSSVQIRAMTSHQPPFRFISPGRVYRSDYDATHTPMFHQIEGVYVDKKIHMGHLKGCLHTFLKAFFELTEVPLRFRPSFFPFTEPSAEVDIACTRTKDAVRVGSGAQWLEILGCGMIHPTVLRNVQIDPDIYQGFAFGIGIERLAMLKYGAPDLRAFFKSDMRWLSHYGFTPSEREGSI